MPLPAEVETVTVEGTILHSDGTGTPETGTVTFYQPEVLRDENDNVVLTPFAYVVTLDVTGSFSVTLPSTNSPNIQPSGFTYKIIVRVSSWRQKFAGEIPYDISNPYPFALIVPVASGGGSSGTVPDATSTVKGILRLAGDLGGTATTPTVPGLALKVGTSRAINTTNGLQGGGDLSADRTLSPVYGTVANTVTEGNDARITGAAPAASPTFTGTVTISGRQVVTPDTLVDAATIATDASLGNHFRVTLGGNRTLGNPTNPVDGQKVLWELIQDGAGNRTITLDTKFALGTDITSVVLSTTGNDRDFMGAVYNSTADLWYVIALAKGY